MRFIRYLALGLFVGAAACDFDQTLAVENPNNPDRGRILRSPTEVQGLASGQFQTVNLGTMGFIGRANTGMMTASLMNASGLANNGLGPRSIIPRLPIDNNPGNAYEFENFADFRILSGVARNTADILERSKAPDFDLDGTAASLNRLNAFTHFVSGVAHGYLSLVYDSAAVARPGAPPADIPPLEDYMAVNAYALAQFDSALVYAARPGMGEIPAGWLTGQGGPTVSPAQFQRIIRSYRARMSAGVARNATERAARPWDAIIADATNGIQADFNVRLSPADGWNYEWIATTLHFRDVNWHQMTNYIIGMADGSGGYAAWLAAGRDERNNFTIVTPDRRFPQGATRAEQNRGGAADDEPLPPGQYFRNRNPGKDQPEGGWRNSQYDHYRFRALADANRVGDLPFFTRAENDMLAAEGYIRTNAFAQAAQLIDRYRVPNGLPPLAGAVNDATTPVPGGTACVPKVPRPEPAATWPNLACGNILEAMKWEKRMETAYTTYGAWFFDSRGWNDLPEGTPLQWPVPWQEAAARPGLSPYNLGGVGGPSGAPPSTYGFGRPNTGW
jgi:hypothetical protein